MGFASKYVTDTCPALPTPLTDADEVLHGWTINDILRLICYITGGAAALISFALFFLHAFNMRNPPEQIKIMRIILVIPIFAALSIVSIVVGQDSVIVEPWKDFYEGMALSTFYLLIMTYVGPDRVAHQQYWANVKVEDDDGNVVHGAGLSLYKKGVIAVNQFVIVQFLIAVITVITQLAGVYCLQSDSIKFAHLWLQIAKTLSNGAAVFAAAKTALRFRNEITHRPIIKQLLAFKLLIGLYFFQNLIFSFIAPHVTPTDTLSYNDITVGIPQTLLCIETIFFAIFFHVAYSHKPYVNSEAVAYYGVAPKDARQAKNPKYHVSPLGAILRAINPISIALSIREIYRAISSSSHSGKDAEENIALNGYAVPPYQSRETSPTPYSGRGI